MADWWWLERLSRHRSTTRATRTNMRIDELFQFHFMTNALIAGTVVAVTASAIGWFMVVRQQAFAGHTLSVIAFPGAAAAALAAVTGGETRSISHESAAIGSVQALALGLGFLFVSLYHGLLTELNSLLFGTFLGITDSQVLVLLGIGAGVLVVLAALARPLLFASVDADVARASGVPVAMLSTAFLLMLGLAVAATSQITGALLVFALLVTPAATAQLITPHPGRSFALSVVIALLVTWLGLSIAYFSIYPVGFYVTSLSFGLYVLVRLVRR